MTAYEKDEVPMLSPTNSKSDEHDDSQTRRFTSRTRSASLSIPMNSMDSYDHSSFVGYTGPLRSERQTSFVQMSGPLYVGQKQENVFRPGQGVFGQRTIESKMERYPSLVGIDQNDWKDNNMKKNEHLLRSGQLGMCNDPYCTTCPTYSNYKGQSKNLISPLDPKFHNNLYGGAKGWAKKMYSFCCPFIPGVMNPHAKVIQRWNKFFVIACMFAVFLDPLFFFLLTVQQENKCIVINRTMTTTIVVLRSMTDFIYLVHILLQFRLAYVAPESRVVGAGDLVDHPKKIALHYLSGYFLLDFFIFLPLPQIIIFRIGSSSANYAKNFLRAALLVQYIPRLCRIFPLLVGQSSSAFVFETAWANFVINLLTFVLSGHVVGSCWYLFGLQRVNQCLRDACRDSDLNCTKFIDCGYGNNQSFMSDPTWGIWKHNVNATSCFSKDGFDYGIYIQAVNLTTRDSLITRYVYSLFWGFQQISTLAGNQTPSYFEGEVLFTMGIVGVGLLLFALLIGNIQNFLLSLGRRRLEMSLRRRDVEQWMSHRRLPEDLRRRVRDAERYMWAATRGVNEEVLLENLPEDLKRDIRRHLCKFIKKVRIFALLDEPILDAVCERLRQKTFIEGSVVLYPNGLIDKMVFIIRGKMESIGEDGTRVELSEGDACGEELLSWCLEHSSISKEGKKGLLGRRLLSTREVTCVTNVEVFTLRAADLEEFTSLYARFLRNTRVQAAIRYDSPYWRGLAALRIQVAWRYRKKRQSRADTGHYHHHHHHHHHHEQPW